MRYLIALSFVACIAKERMVPAVAPSPNAPQAQFGEVKVWANTALWSGTPSDTEAWVLPVGVDIQNDGNSAVEWNLDDVLLVDDLGNRTKPFFVPSLAIQKTTGGAVDAEMLRANMRKNPPSTEQSGAANSQTAVFMRDGGRAGPSGAGAWIDATGMATQPPYSWKEEVRFVGAPSILTYRSLTDRTIAAHSRVTGFLYFPRTKAGAKHVTLEWKQAKIPFDVVVVQ